MQDLHAIMRIEAKSTFLNGITWPYDKYPDMAQLTAGNTVTLIDQDGPGIITNLHVSHYGFLADLLENGGLREPDAESRLIIRIYYDNQPEPAIEMPLMSFLGDIDCQSDYFSTVYFSKVRSSHNFRLPIPFRQHIRIEFFNPSATDLFGYSDVQWDQVASLPADHGYLQVDYRKSTAEIPETIITLMDFSGQGKIVAHWLTLSADIRQAAHGEYMCEGNQEFYLDGSDKASLEYLGTEDVYGYSWGFAQTGSDGYAAIIKKVALPNDGASIGMLRCRTQDSITFRQGCKVLLDYSQEYFSPQSINRWHVESPVFAARDKLSFGVAYSSCFYYYAAYAAANDSF